VRDVRMREGSDEKVEDEHMWFWNEVSEER
jgi:hypothetical protein